MNRKSISFHINRVPYRLDCNELWTVHLNRDDTISIPVRIEMQDFKRDDPDTYDVNPKGVPLANLTREDMQNLFDELWKQGCRPKDFVPTEPIITEVKAHLQDMKALVAKAYKVEFKGE